MRMMRIAGAFALLAGGAQAEQIGPMVESWQAGVVCPSEFGQAGAASDIAFIARTQVVPAVVGMGFGIRAQVNVPGGIPGATIVVDHPPFTAGGATRESYPAAFSDQGPSGFFYVFETPQEAAIGTWTVSALLGQQLIYSLEFHVVAPRAGDGLLQACGVY